VLEVRAHLEQRGVREDGELLRRKVRDLIVEVRELQASVLPDADAERAGSPEAAIDALSAFGSNLAASTCAAHRSVLSASSAVWMTACCALSCEKSSFAFSKGNMTCSAHAFSTSEQDPGRAAHPRYRDVRRSRTSMLYRSRGSWAGRPAAGSRGARGCSCSPA
jgi:hypothetical protein